MIGLEWLYSFLVIDPTLGANLGCALLNLGTPIIRTFGPQMTLKIYWIHGQPVGPMVGLLALACACLIVIMKERLTTELLIYVAERFNWLTISM